MDKKTLIINESWCKGCGICVALCPRQALIIINGKVAVAEADRCVKCGQCEQRCPDYAIYIRIGEEAAVSE